MDSIRLYQKLPKTDEARFVVEEADESVFWLEIFTESNIINKNISNQLMKEGNEILKIVSRARKTTSSN